MTRRNRQPSAISCENKRSIILPPFLAVAMVALVSVVSLLLPLDSPGAEKEQDPLLAQINGRELRLSEVYASIETLPLGDQIDVRDDLEVYVEAMINEEVLFQWALATDFAGKSKLRKEVKDLVVRHLIDKHVRSKLRASDADARTYYDANRNLIRMEHVRVRRILLKDRAECERLLAKIDSEETFIEFAKIFSLDKETAANGGDSGIMMRPEEGQGSGYEMEYFDMKLKEVRIFDTSKGCLIVRQIYYNKPPMPRFEDVKDRLKGYLRSIQEVNLVDELMEQAGKGIKVVRHYRAAGAPFASSGAPSPSPTASPAAPPRRGGGTAQ